MPDIFILLSILILGSIALTFFLLYLKELKTRKNFQTGTGEILDKTEQKAFQMLHDAVKKAQNILSSAELEGIKIIAETKLSTGKLDKRYAEKLEESIQVSQNIISKEVATAQQTLSVTEQEYIKFLNELRSRASRLETETQELTINRINQLFENFEQRVSNFLLKAENSSTESIELELKSARQLIETYKNQQLSLIDENIIAMMEQTLSIVLNKKLSLGDQLDLVYEALEKAKVEKFIV